MHLQLQNLHAVLIASIDIATCYILWEWHVEVWSLMQGSRHFFGLKSGAAPAAPMLPALHFTKHTQIHTSTSTHKHKHKHILCTFRFSTSAERLLLASCSFSSSTSPSNCRIQWNLSLKKDTSEIRTPL